MRLFRKPDAGVPRFKAIKFTCWVYRSLSTRLLDVFRELALPEVYVQSARGVSLRTRRGLLGLRSGSVIDENLCDVYRFYLPPEFETPVLREIVEHVDLTLPGRGSIYTEEVTLVRPSMPVFDEARLNGHTRGKIPAQTGFAGMCCIVQRGEGNALARSVLEMGFSVPVITYGKGMGIRDKLGLLRVTIPVEKEIVSFVVNRQDAVEALRLVSDSARLEHPGRGFIYLFPIRHAVVNTKIHRGNVEHVASIEQVIAAIDEMSGSTAWRRRTVLRPKHEESIRARFLTDLLNYTLFDREGRTADLVRRAMDAGASGATLSNLRFDHYGDVDDGSIPRSREMSDLIITEKVRDDVLKSTVAAGLGLPESTAFVELSAVEMASTYRGRR